MNIADTRARVRKREKAAKDKIRRNTDNGIFLERSQFDPIKHTGKPISKMSTRELKAYEKKLNAFTDRNNQFVAGHRGEPLSRATVEEYKRYENARNIKVRKHVQSYDDVFIEPAGVSVKQRRDMNNATGLDFVMGGSGGQPDSSPYRVRSLDVSGVLSENKLREFLGQVKKQTRMQNWLVDVVRAQRDNHLKFLANHGNDKLSDAVSSLTDRQFDILMNTTNYSNLTRFVYLKEGIRNEEFRAKMEADSSGEIGHLVSWAKRQ